MELLSNILRALKRSERESTKRIEIGNIVTFHDGVLYDPYARVITWEDYVKNLTTKGLPQPSESIRRNVEKGEWHCLRTDRDAYFLYHHQH